MQLYSDENVPLPVEEELRRLGHDVLTAHEGGQQAATDEEILSRALAVSRAVLTHDRRDFNQPHRKGVAQSGIILASDDPSNHLGPAQRIDAALQAQMPGRWCLRVKRPPSH
jgi:predicted nuclease of predicted toxin-antitoxin system